MLNLPHKKMRQNLQSLIILLITVNCIKCDTGYFWHVTDFHYDPTYSSSKLSCMMAESEGKMGRFGNMWCDSPLALIESSVNAMVTIKPDVDFMLWTGDTVLHANITDLSHSFNAKILDNVTDLLKTTFPDIPVYASFGNHDSYPSDQFQPRNMPLYTETLSRWRSWINDSTQDASFRKGGYYTVMTKYNIRIVALNTILYYKPNKAVMTNGDPAGQFEWLTSVLSNAARNKERVIITAHVAPGFAPNGTLDLYSHQNDRLVNIMRQFSDVIVAMHFGHEHADAIKLLRNNAGDAAVPIFLAPSVTPIRFGPVHNPGVRLVKYDRISGRQIEISQYYLDFFEANSAGNDNWKLEYKTSEAYGLADLSPRKLESLIKKMKNPSSVEFKKYWKHYVVSVKEEFTEDCDSVCHAQVVCGYTELVKADFDQCFIDMMKSDSTKLTHWFPLISLSFILLML